MLQGISITNFKKIYEYIDNYYLRHPWVTLFLDAEATEEDNLDYLEVFAIIVILSIITG